MSRGSYQHMLKVASKKEALGEVVNNIEDYTEEDIDKIISQPVWIRKHLKTHLEQTLTNKRMSTIPNIGDTHDIGADTQHVAYKTYKYLGHEELEIKNGAGFSLTVESEDIFMMVSTVEVKVNSTVVAINHEETQKLIGCSEQLDSMTITEYNEYLQQVLDQKHFSGKDDRDNEYGWLSSIRIDK